MEQAGLFPTRLWSVGGGRRAPSVRRSCRVEARLNQKTLQF